MALYMFYAELILSPPALLIHVHIPWPTRLRDSAFTHTVGIACVNTLAVLIVGSYD